MRKPSTSRLPRAKAIAGQNLHTHGWVRDDRWSLFTAAMVWLLIVYLVIPYEYWTGDAARDTVTATAGGSVFARAIKVGLIALSSLVVLWRSSLAILLVRTLNPFFLVFLALVPLSILWSIDRSATSARYVSLLSITLTCFAFALVGWHQRRFQSVVRPVVTLLLIASLIFGVLHPELAIETGEGSLKNAWRGLASQKNQFGELASFGVLFWLHASLFREARWQIALPCSGIAWTCVLLSRSSTSLLSSALSSIFMLLLVSAPLNLRRYMPYIVGSFAVFVMIYALAVLNLIPGFSFILEPIALLTGKDLTFTGRSGIWDIIKEHIQSAPWLGSGYGAYWTGASLDSPSYIVFTTRMYFYPGEAHNGYLEMVNDLGFVGLACLLGYLMIWVRQSLRLMKFDRAQAALFLAIFFQQAITNLSESTWLTINSAFAIAVVTLATFALARALLEQRLTQWYGNRGANP
jgi:exopolysaccharide production protein ExoQ